MPDSIPAAPAEAPPPRSQAFSAIADMENDVRTVKELADGLVMMVSGADRVALDEGDKVHAVLRVATILGNHAKDVEAGWDVAFVAAGGQA